MSAVRFRSWLMLLAGGLAMVASASAPEDPLPSWSEGPTKRSIRDFVTKVTTPGSPSFVPVEERIAVFDNDGTLWAEKPAYFQLLYAFDRAKALAEQHPELKQKQPYKALLDGDLDAVASEKMIAEIMKATHAGMTTEEFESTVNEWITTAKHPRLKRPYTDLTYLPMRELLDHLRSAGFRTYIVSGGGIDFLRVWSERVYGVPPEQVLGTSIETKLEERGGEMVLVRLPEIDFVDDGPGKVVGIHRFIGRRPIAAFGNSEGDRQMLEWTMAGDGPRFALLVHHTDDVREWAYDRDSRVGRLDRTLDEAKARGFTVVDMKRDWKRVFSFE